MHFFHLLQLVQPFLALDPCGFIWDLFREEQTKANGTLQMAATGGWGVLCAADLHRGRRSRKAGPGASPGRSHTSPAPVGNSKREKDEHGGARCPPVSASEPSQSTPPCNLPQQVETDHLHGKIPLKHPQKQQAVAHSAFTLEKPHPAKLLTL